MDSIATDDFDIRCGVSVWRRASPLHRPREERLTHPADTSRTNLAAALALLFEVAAFQTPNPWGGLLACMPVPRSSVALTLRALAAMAESSCCAASWLMERELGAGGTGERGGRGGCAHTLPVS
jgi:hypothetical protein